jgi:dipeptidyl aminopeptidase/acylaminoacyl peptidase
MLRRIAIGAGVAAIVGAGAYVGASAIVYDRLTSVPGGCPPSQVANSPAGFSVPNPPDFDPSPWFMPAPETVSFPSRDAGIMISGWYVPAEAADAPAVVIVHGHMACKHDHSVLLPAGMLHRNGFSVLLIDLRDHGDSTYEDGRYAGGTEEYRDVLGAWDWLQTAKATPIERIGLLGVSLGAATVLIATGEESRVAATWEDSSYADIEVAIRAELERNGYPTFLEPAGLLIARILSGDDLRARSPLAAVHKLAGRPLFITHGDVDTRLDVGYARDLDAAVHADGGDVETWIVAGAGHTMAMFLHPAEYERRLAAFFRRSIAG